MHHWLAVVAASSVVAGACVNEAPDGDEMAIAGGKADGVGESDDAAIAACVQRVGGGTPFDNGGGVEVHRLMNAWVQDFHLAQDGSGAICVHPDGWADAISVRWGFRDAYFATFRSGSSELGLPRTDEYSAAPGARQDFDHGYLTWDASNNQSLVVATAWDPEDPGCYEGGTVAARAALIAAGYTEAGSIQQRFVYTTWGSTLYWRDVTGYLFERGDYRKVAMCYGIGGPSYPMGHTTTLFSASEGSTAIVTVNDARVGGLTGFSPLLDLDITATATTDRAAFDYHGGLFMNGRWDKGSSYVGDVKISVGLDGNVQQLQIGTVLYIPQ